MQTSSTSLIDLRGHPDTLCGYAAVSFGDLEVLVFGRACGSSMFVLFLAISVDTIGRKKNQNQNPVFYYGKAFGVMKIQTEKFLPHGLLDSL